MYQSLPIDILAPLTALGPALIDPALPSAVVGLSTPDLVPQCRHRPAALPALGPPGGPAGGAGVLRFRRHWEHGACCQQGGCGGRLSRKTWWPGGCSDTPRVTKTAA